MRTFNLLVTLGLCWGHATGQAPASANLWRVSTASLARPAALQAGPLGIAWNPAAPLEISRLSLAVQFVQTSEVVGLSSLSASASRTFARHGRLILSGARTDVRDLVRTSSSPTSLGTIPVYEQFLGLGAQYEIKSLVLGGHLRLHEERFDVEHNDGLTLDFGARIQLNGRLSVAAATHFLPVDLSGRETTDYYAGIEYVAVPDLTIGAVPAQLIARYGTILDGSERLDHMASIGVSLGGFFDLDASVSREAGYGSEGWRPAFAVLVQIGQYELAIARSSGINDLGAIYRIALAAKLLP